MPARFGKDNPLAQRATRSLNGTVRHCFLEDTSLIAKDDAELLTPGAPYSAEDIELSMR